MDGMFSQQSDFRSRILSQSHLASIKYHDIFDYPLTKEELEKWEASKDLRFTIQDSRIKTRNGYYFLKGREGIVLKRLSRKKASKKKLKIARRAGMFLARIPSVKFVGATGALAMKNADEDSDIDLMIITSKGTLWTTRLIAYCLLLIAGFKLRRPSDKDQKDKLCLNMWLDERDLIFRKRSIFTAHEIAQIASVVNKDFTYEKLLSKNKWILDYWPKSVGISSKQQVATSEGINSLLTAIYLLPATLLEQVMFKLQYKFMKNKITREVVTPTRAFFHPFDWSSFVKARLWN